MLHAGQQHINQIKRLLFVHVFHVTSVWKYFLHRATSSVQSAHGGARHQWESCLGGDVLLTRRQQSRLQITNMSEHKQTYSIHSGWCSFMGITALIMSILMALVKRYWWSKEKNSLDYKLNWLISSFFLVHMGTVCAYRTVSYIYYAQYLQQILIPFLRQKGHTFKT